MDDHEDKWLLEAAENAEAEENSMSMGILIEF